MYMNGAPTGNTIPITGWNHWTPFTISSGFVAGQNTILFRGDQLGSVQSQPDRVEGGIHKRHRVRSLRAAEHHLDHSVAIFAGIQHRHV